MQEILNKISKARFETIDELYIKKNKIREEVQKFNLDTIDIYKWYFYHQLCYLKEPIKEAFWDYVILPNINIFVESRLEEKYRIFCDNRKTVVENDTK